MKNYSDQELIDRINQAPPAVQEKVGALDTALEIAAIGKEKKLHIDQIGKIAELNRNMLLGLIGPEECLKELVMTGISDSDARQIMAEINQKIFLPLREQMKNEMTAESHPIQPKGPIQPIKPAKPVTPQPEIVQPPIIDEKLLENREEPHIEFINKIKKPLPVTPVTSIQPKPVPSVPKEPSKPYTIDPYREPIDEK